nr:YesL family protein [uncultured Acetatifactor sp.]
MNSLLNPEGKVMLFFTKIAYSAYLNILWFLCCLPIVTAGASTTALFYVTLKMAKDEEGNVTKSFFQAFRQNFKKATVIWLILLGLGVVLALDGYVFYHMRYENAFWTVGTAVFLVALAAYAVVLMYIFPLLARFENTVRAMLFNSLMLGMRFLLCTATMAVIYFVMVFVVINVFTPAVVFGEGLCALLCSYLLSNILLMCEEKAERPESETMADTADMTDMAEGEGKNGNESVPEGQDYTA